MMLGQFDDIKTLVVRPGHLLERGSDQIGLGGAGLSADQIETQLYGHRSSRAGSWLISRLAWTPVRHQVIKAMLEHKDQARSRSGRSPRPGARRCASPAGSEHKDHGRTARG